MNLYHILEAIGILVSGLLFYSYTYSWFPAGRQHGRRRRAALNGIAFGGVAVFLMIARIEVSPGVFVDPRVIPVALIGLFEGWPAAVIAAAIAAGYRLWWMGGSGKWAGVVTLALTCLAAGVVHAWARRSGRVGTRHALMLTGLVLVATLVGFLMLGRRGIELLAPVWWQYMLMLAVGIAGLARLFRDVAEQHRLAEGHHRFRAIVDEATDVIRIIDPDTLRILDTNRADSELSGYAREQILERTTRDFWPEDPAERATHEAVIADARARGYAEALGVAFCKRSGEVVPVDATYRFLSYEGRRYGIVIFHAASYRLGAEAARREAAELRAVTLLARAAAHEIHNPLAVILGYVQLLQPRFGAETKEAGWTRQMVEAVGRIRDAVERLTRLIRIESTRPAGQAPAMLDTQKSSAEDPLRSPSAPPGSSAPPSGS